MTTRKVAPKGLVKIRGYDKHNKCIWEATPGHVNDHAHANGRLAVLRLVAELSGNAIHGRLNPLDAMTAIHKAVMAELDKAGTAGKANK